MENDPILSVIFDEAPEGLFGEEQEPKSHIYGLGTWKGAILLDIQRYPKDDIFGYRIGLQLDLKGSHGNKPYTGKIDLERTLEANGHDIEEWKLTKETKKREALNQTLQAFRINRPITCAINEEEQYNALVAVFRQCIGLTCDVKIVEDGKNVRDENNESGWRFEGNGYSRLAWVRWHQAAKAKPGTDIPF